MQDTLCGRRGHHPSRSCYWFGAALIAVGTLFLLHNLGLVPFGVGWVWPAALIALGARIAIGVLRHRRRSPNGGVDSPKLAGGDEVKTSDYEEKGKGDDGQR